MGDEIELTTTEQEALNGLPDDFVDGVISGKYGGILSELPPPRVSVLKRMIVGDVVLFRDSRFNAVSAVFAKVPGTYEQLTAFVVGGNKGLSATKVIVVKRTE